MKSINEMSTKELAEYAVTLPRWRWLPGMRCVFPPQTGGCGAIVVPRSATLIYGTLKDRQEEIWPYWDVPDGCVPDLDDSATVGCVMGMVRNKHSDHLWCEHFYASDSVESWKVVKTRGYFHQIVSSGPTEAHALIAALAKELP